MNKGFWNGRTVLVTGHTGFKGAWLVLWLHSLGAKVSGISLPPETDPSLFEAADIEKLCQHHFVLDLREKKGLAEALAVVQPEVVFHLAAQALVLPSFEDPIGTFETNVMGTALLLDACRQTSSIKALVNVTTDKVYFNQESERAYREDDLLGGKDPYSASKACSELVTQSFYHSFFKKAGSMRMATVRAGNVVGGGDWSKNRLIPDCLRSLLRGETLFLRAPKSVRPWQFVLDPLHGYMMVAEQLMQQPNAEFTAWNFSPDDGHVLNVEELVSEFLKEWGSGHYEIDPDAYPAEAKLLRLDNTKAKTLLGWRPLLDASTTLKWTASWYRSFNEQASATQLCLRQIQEFEAMWKR